MIGELIPTGVTFGVGRNSLNDAFSGTAEFNNIILGSGANFSGGTGGGIFYSGGTDFYDIFGSGGKLWSASTGGNSIIANNGTGNVAGGYSIAAGVSSMASIYSFAFGFFNTAGTSYSTVVGGGYNYVGGGHSFIGAGYNNYVVGQSSSIVGGSYNLASGNKSFVGGGYINSAATVYSSVVGGLGNLASGNFSFIGGGQVGIASGLNSFVGGGISNVASGNWSSVVGGQSNLASGPRSFIGGGGSNIANAYTSVIAGGQYNLASGQRSFIGGGYRNSATTIYSVVVGGRLNLANTNSYATIVGGQQNTASGSHSFVGGGRQNLASGTRSFVGGGRYNSATTSYSTIAGGQQNLASGIASFIGGGVSNAASGARSSVLGGSGNTVSGIHSAIAGGSGMTNSFNDTFMTMNARLAENGGVIYSAGTDLYNIFLTTAGGNDITRVQPGSNITTGGTGNDPIVNLVASPSVNNITFSGTASGRNLLIENATDLYPFYFSGINYSVYTANSSTIPSFLISGDSAQLIGFGVNESGGAGVAFGVRGSAEPTYSGYGKQGDSYLRAGNVSNGLNIIDGPDASKENYIRFFAGVNANTTPHMHIQGSGSTIGYIGINEDAPTERLHLNGSIKMVDGSEGYGKLLYDSGDGVMAWSAFTFGSTTPSTFDYGTTGTTLGWDVQNVSTSAKVIFSGNTTLNVLNATSGDFGTLKITQDGVGGRTLTLGAGTHRVANGGSGSITLTSTPGATDIISFFYDGTEFNWSVGYNYN